MNLVETYVTNITKEEDIWTDFHLHLHRITADFNCYGRIEKQVSKIVNDYDYEIIKEKGYYWT